MSDSASAFGKDLGLMHELVVSGNRVGFTREDWARLVHDQSLLAWCLDAARGKIPPAAYGPHGVFADLWQDPKVPAGYRPHQHQRGPVRYNVTTTRCFHLEMDMPWKMALLRLALAKHANACLLQFFLAYPEMIPDDMRGRSTMFLGSTFKDDLGRPMCVRLEQREDGTWHEQITLVGIPLRKDMSFALLG